MYIIRNLLCGIAALLGAAASVPLALGSGKPQYEQIAPVALLVDIQSGQTLLSQNADRRFIPASVTKVMTVYVAFEMLASGEITPEQKFALSDTAAKEWYRTGSTMFLEPGEPASVDTLLKGITSVSANDASIILAEGSTGSVDNWTARMNAAAQALGMRNSYFGTPNGWPDGGKTFTTARDLEKLAKALITKYPEHYAEYFGRAGLSHNGFAQANHDPISGVVEGADGLKTGYTDQAGHNFLGSAKRDETRLILVLAGMGSDQERALIARQSMEWGFRGFDRRLLFNSGANVAVGKVQNGVRNKVQLTAQRAINVVMPAGYKGSVMVNLIYEGPLKAPIAKGEQVAELEILVGGLPPARVPLLAAENIDEAGPLRRISNAFQNWLG